MGWLWASQPSDKPPTPSTEPKPAEAKPAPTEQSPSQSTDPEIQKLYDLFKADASSTSQPPSSSTSSQKQPSTDTSSESNSSITSWLSLKSSRPQEEVPNAPPRGPVSEALLPTEMSCRQAFDLAWSCNSLGGQWNAVYRHGEMRSCSEHWDDFWFCMRVKSHTGQAKADEVRQHYRNKEYSKYYAPGRHSSEDVWESRPERLAPGLAFSQGFQTNVNDDEWRKQESERRNQIRKDLGYTNPST
ncbi:unnamed protein product [Clonostachys rosea]|uniref:Early meiotic induction protein 1 n=1 Tax=Bionectria ochroleuca TaxID=29856 RepID=A0ABY6UKF0_BIOOC|nr:unnamed protein product [Clonostachys rosea]